MRGQKFCPVALIASDHGIVKLSSFITAASSFRLSSLLKTYGLLNRFSELCPNVFIVGHRNRSDKHPVFHPKNANSEKEIFSRS